MSDDTQNDALTELIEFVKSIYRQSRPQGLIADELRDLIIKHGPTNDDGTPKLTVSDFALE